MATAPSITTKSEQASRLRAKVSSFTTEIEQLQQKLETARRELDRYQSKRDELAEAIADGKPQRSTSAELHAKIVKAQLPVEALQKRLAEKQSALDHTRTALETLNHEIALEERLAARQARFDALAKQGGYVAMRIAEKLRALLEEDLPAFDAVRDALTREFINVNGQLNAEIAGSPEASLARAVMHELEASFQDGPYLKIERQLLRQGWEPRGDLVFQIKNLRAPKKS
jgi:DNA repair exonuclease SbcCD ATPase subunit